MAARMSIRASVSGESGLRLLPDSFKTRLVSAADETMESLDRIWTEAGYEDSERQYLLGDLLNKIKMTLSQELMAEKEILDHAKKQVFDKLRIYNDYAAKLGRPPLAESKLGKTCTDSLTLLDKITSDIELEVSQREEVFQEELEKIEDLSQALGETVRTLNDFKCPGGGNLLSDSRLELVRKHYSSLETIKDQRIATIKEIANVCLQHMSDLEVMGEGWEAVDGDGHSDFVQCNKALSTFATTGEWHFGIHTDDVAIMEVRCQSLSDEKDRRRDELANLGSEIARLWTLLRIPSNDREKFQSSFKMNLSMETLKKGQEELDRLVSVRKSSLKKVVASIREEIQSLWNESGLENENQQRMECPVFFEDIERLEDNSVDLHEEYCSALRHRVEELRPILAKIYKREQIVQERIDLEQIQMNPERLTARGPNAREERKREEGMIMRVKNLEKLSKEIQSQIQAWEETHGPFYFANERYFDRMALQEEKYIEIRDSLRNSRKKKESIKPEPIVPKTMLRRPTPPSLSNLGSSLNSMSSKSKDMFNNTVLDLSSIQLSSNHNPNPHQSSQSLLVAPSDIENRDRNSTGSDDTMYTSATEVRDRESCATVIRQGGLAGGNYYF